MAELYAHDREPARARAGPHGARRHRRRRRRAARAQRPPRPPRSQRLGAELKEVVGRDDLNINSPIQLREILYAAPPAGRGLTPIKKTKTGASTDAATLEKLRDEWPEFIGPLLQYREVEKLRGTYGEGLLAEVAADGRIHATFNQTVARTGRLSSDRPNLHNIPVRREEGRLFRKAFVAAPGGKLLVADYNQIELRCIAHLAADPGLIAAFTERRGHPQRHGVADLRRRARRRHARPALEGEDGLLRAGLRHGGLRARPAPEHPDRGGGEDPRRLLRGLPQRQGVHGRDGRRGPQAGLHRDAVRPPPADPRAAQRQLADPPGGGAPGDERRHPGPRRRHLQGRPGARRRGAARSAGWRAGSCCRSTTRCSSRCPSDEREVVGPLVVDLMRHAADLDVPLEVNVAWGTTWADAKS